MFLLYRYNRFFIPLFHHLVSTLSLTGSILSGSWAKPFGFAHFPCCAAPKIVAPHKLNLTVSLYLVTYKIQARRGDTLKNSDRKGKFLLTNREREVFELLVQDKTTKEIAQQLYISEKTVRNHISNVMQKLNVKGRSQAVIELIKLGELKI